MDSRERFTAAATDYARYRPDYPDEVVDLVADYAGISPGAVVADVACGTGISSRRFARRGYRVIGVEPNEAMLEKARDADAGPEYRRGDAVNTGLETGSVDLVTCAQALHWIDLSVAVDEWQRILGPDGPCAAFWNLRLDEGWQKDYERLLEEWSSEYDVARHASSRSGSRDAFVRSSPLCFDVTTREVPNAQTLTWEGLRGRAFSSSYVLHGVADKTGYEKALRRLFDEHEEAGSVVFRYRTWILLWRLRGG